MFVHFFMTPEPVTIHQDSTVHEAGEILREQLFRHLPVVDDNMVLQGMVTDRDLRSARPSTILDEDERQRILDRVRMAPVKDIMSEKFYCLDEESTIDDALQFFTIHRIGALPVVNVQDQVVGIFSLNDMMAAYRCLFGLGEKGSMLVSIKDTGELGSLSTLVRALDDKNIRCTRLIRSPGRDGREPPAIYLRVNTLNLSSVHQVVEAAGFTLLTPDRINREVR